MELALSFHHAVRDDHEGIAASIGRPWELTRSGCYAYYVGIAHFMAALPLDVRTQRAGSTDSRPLGNGGVIWPPPGATACASPDKSLRPRHADRAAGAWMRSSVEVQDADRLTIPPFRGDAGCPHGVLEACRRCNRTGRKASLPASKFYSATQYKKTSGGTVTVVFGMTTESILVKSPAKTVKKGQKVGHSWGGRSVADTGDCSATGFMKSNGSTYYTPPVNRLC